MMMPVLVSVLVASVRQHKDSEENRLKVRHWDWKISTFIVAFIKDQSFFYCMVCRVFR